MNANPSEATRWKPGQSGNPGGRPKTRLIRSQLLDAVNATDGEGITALRRIVDQLIAKAVDGDIHAIKEIADRIDGKVPTSIVGDDESDPVSLITRIVLVPGKSPNAGSEVSMGTGQ